MRVTLNGSTVDLPGGATVADLVALRAEGQRRVAVARGGDVVPRSTWDAVTLQEGDVVELLAATAGG